MAGDRDFDRLLEGLRAGDQRAATDFVRRFDGDIQRGVRHLLNDMKLSRVLEPADICQTVFANFFARVALGQFELQSDEQLFRLLATMARNQVMDEARRHQAQRRDLRRHDDDALGEALEGVFDRQPTPSKIVALDELVAQIQERLAPEVRVLAQMRVAGFDWPEIAEQVGGSAEALRKKLTRALDRVLADLDLGEAPEV